MEQKEHELWNPAKLGFKLVVLILDRFIAVTFCGHCVDWGNHAYLAEYLWKLNLVM